MNNEHNNKEENNLESAATATPEPNIKPIVTTISEVKEYTVSDGKGENTRAIVSNGVASIHKPSIGQHSVNKAKLAENIVIYQKQISEIESLIKKAEETMELLTKIENVAAGKITL